MLPTFVIGLREGLEAALIVAIIAAFLRRQGRRDLIKWVFIGVGTAVLLCAAAGVALHIYAADLPQRQQEGLETVIGALAVGMVTYMVVWMKRHSRELKGQLETLAGGALGADAQVGTSRAARALVLMAFLGVLREGIETVIFLLAVFDQSSSGAAAGFGAVLGIVVAVGLGYGIYRGGVRLNLSKFFRATGFVLVLVAAGLVVNALHTAHEAGWLNAGQGATFDLTWLVDPGSVQSSLLTGMLGLQPRPVVIEVIGWLVYFVPVATFVAWPPGHSPARASVSRALLLGGGVAATAAVVLAVLAPSAPAQRPETASAQVVAAGSHTAQVRLDGRTVDFANAGSASHHGVVADIYTATTPGQLAAAMPTTVSYARVAALNGGRLPIGVQPRLAVNATVHYSDAVHTMVWIAPRTLRIIDIRSVERATAAVASPGGGTFALSRPVRIATTGLPSQAADAAASAARADSATLDRRTLLIGLAWTLGVVGILALLAGARLAMTPRRRPVAAAKPVRTLVNS
jgi:high-affinity iron transporter